LEELRRLEGEATPGTWERGQGVTPYVAKRDWVEVRNHATIGVEIHPEDAEFIVAARNQLPRILDALDAVLALADKYQKRAIGATNEDWQACIVLDAAATDIRATITDALEGKQ
jgi:hypothetical protein